MTVTNILERDSQRKGVCSFILFLWLTSYPVRHMIAEYVLLSVKQSKPCTEISIDKLGLGRAPRALTAPVTWRAGLGDGRIVTSYLLHRLNFL